MRTALHAACEAGHTLCVELLCQNNAKLDVADAQGRTPMDIAAERGAAEIMDTLELNGAAKYNGGKMTVNDTGIASADGVADADDVML
jgi:ankyrin repeat protein